MSGQPIRSATRPGRGPTTSNKSRNDHHAAVRSLAFKWIRIAVGCWKDSMPYNDSITWQLSDGEAPPWPTLWQTL